MKHSKALLLPRIWRVINTQQLHTLLPIQPPLLRLLKQCHRDTHPRMVPLVTQPMATPRYTASLPSNRYEVMMWGYAYKWETSLNMTCPCACVLPRFIHSCHPPQTVVVVSHEEQNNLAAMKVCSSASLGLLDSNGTNSFAFGHPCLSLSLFRI